MKLYKLILISALLIFHQEAFCQPKLKIGDKCPDIDIEVINFPKTKMKLSDFKGKAIILDFWATWCAPCVKLFPKTDSLEIKYAGELVILPVTQESESTTSFLLNTLERNAGIKVKSVIADTALNTIFNHMFLPHEVWINKQGIIVAITSSDMLTEENIDAFVNGKELHFSEKKDFEKREYNFKKPIFQQIGDSDYVSYRMITKFMPGVASVGGATNRKIMCYNQPILNLYKFAYGEGKLKYMFGSGNVMLVTKDSTKYTYGTNWNQEQMGTWNISNCYCYELVVAAEDTLNKWKLMQKDLDNLYPLTASIEKISHECIVLRSSNIKKYTSMGGGKSLKENPYYIKYDNIPISRLMTYLNLNYQNEDIPVIDETGYSGNIDIEINANIRDFASLKRELAKYGLEVSRERKDIDILVVKDKQVK